MPFPVRNILSTGQGVPVFFLGNFEEDTVFFFGRGVANTAAALIPLDFVRILGLGNFHISLPLGVKRNIDEHLSSKFVGKNTLFNLDLFGHGAWKK